MACHGGYTSGTIYAMEMIATNMFRPVLTNDDLFWAQLFPDMFTSWNCATSLLGFSSSLQSPTPRVRLDTISPMLSPSDGETPFPDLPRDATAGGKRSSVLADGHLNHPPGQAGYHTRPSAGRRRLRLRLRLQRRADRPGR